VKKDTSRGTRESPDRIRINRFLAMSGVSSRRKAEELVLNGKVAVNGQRVSDLATTVDPSSDRITVQGKPVTPAQRHIYIVLNKPRDTITTMSDERGRKTVMGLVRTRGRVFPIGRLDRNTTGVLLFTNDGKFANRLMHPRHEVPKSYKVTCDRTVTRLHLEKLRSGVPLGGKKTAPAEVLVLPGGGGKVIGIVLHEGRNRQVRRMFEALGYEIGKLDRVAYGPVTKEGIARGGTRRLTRGEVRALKDMAGIKEEWE
jgi:pseudouridine synthase